MTQRQEVKEFLQKLKAILSISPRILYDNRDKNSTKTLANLGIIPKERDETIANLKIEDYSKGPIPENQYGGVDMWVFGKIVRDTEMYIKLTIIDATNGIICISFHEAKHKMEYPLKKK